MNMMRGFFTLIAIGAAFLGPCSCHCPDGWVYFQGSCYLFSHEGHTYTDAEHYCIQHQAHLAKIDHSIEDNFLKAYSSELKDAKRWIGLSDSDIEGFWKWNDGSHAVYINWYPGQPEQGRSANCVALFPVRGYGWVDEPCSKTYYPICEKPEPGCPVAAGAIVG